MGFMDSDGGIGATLFSEDEIESRIKELGAEITADYQGRRPLLVCVLRGAYAFTTDLSRCIDLPVEVDFIAVSSYGSATSTSGVVRLVKDLEQDIADRDVLLIEDIVDSGLTLRYLRRTLQARLPASLEVCSLLARDRSDLSGIGVKYCGFSIGDDFIVGYGLDVDQRYRNLRHLAVYDRANDPLAR